MAKVRTGKALKHGTGARLTRRVKGVWKEAVIKNGKIRWVKI